MNDTPRWRRYLRFFGQNIEADVQDEVRFHMEMRIRDYESLGMTRAEAERAAAERFGDRSNVEAQLTNMTLHGREVRDGASGSTMWLPMPGSPCVASGAHPDSS